MNETFLWFTSNIMVYYFCLTWYSIMVLSLQSCRTICESFFYYITKHYLKSEMAQVNVIGHTSLPTAGQVATTLRSLVSWLDRPAQKCSAHRGLLGPDTCPGTTWTTARAPLPQLPLPQHPLPLHLPWRQRQHYPPLRPLKTPSPLQAGMFTKVTFPKKRFSINHCLHWEANFSF